MSNVSRINYVFFKESTSTGVSPTLNIQGTYQTANIEITGTATFEITIEGQVIGESDWFEIAVANLRTVDLLTSITENGVYQLDLTAWGKIRLNIKSIAGGNVSARAKVVG